MTPCPACRIAGRAGALRAIVGAQSLAPEDAPPGVWPLKCNVCGCEDDGNRLPLSRQHAPFPLPVVIYQAKAFAKSESSA